MRITFTRVMPLMELIIERFCKRSTAVVSIADPTRNPFDFCCLSFVQSVSRRTAYTKAVQHNIASTWACCRGGDGAREAKSGQGHAAIGIAHRGWQAEGSMTG